MIIVGGADEAVVGDVHELPQILDTAGSCDDVIDKFLRSDACGLCLLLYLLTVLVGTGEKHDIVAAHSLVSCDGVGCDGAVGVTDMQLIGGVVDGCCDVECSLFHYNSPVLYSHGASVSVGVTVAAGVCVGCAVGLTVGLVVGLGVAEGDGDGHLISSGW